MVIAVASGKGGTGKTTVSVSLAAALAADRPVSLVDLDVEAPNCHLFLDVDWQAEENEYLSVPVVDEQHCTRCGVCSDACQFKAIAVLGDVIVTFDPMCHGCTACWTLCPEKVISQGRRELGQVKNGPVRGVDGLHLYMGSLRVGEAMSPPLMKRVMQRVDTGGAVIIDAPPGTSCPVMTATGFADAMLLVTEPTPFGLYDLKLAVEALRPMNKPMGVIINRAGMGDDRVERYCAESGLEVLATIPFDRAIAEGYSQGLRLGQIRPEMDRLLLGATDRLQQMAGARGGAS